jgi:uncharacterized repeat protein (TIGR01451 family)
MRGFLGTLRCRRPQRSATRWLVLCGALLALAFLFVPGALAVHDTGLFELDGNAVDEAASGQDWNTALASSPSGNHVASVGVTDALNGNDDIFTGGSSDTNDINTWSWTTSTAPDKADLEHAYASGYFGSDGHLYLYFGADRYAVNGDTNVGFWFLKNNVSKNGDGTFSGTHTVGDIFVVSAFTQGGSTPEIIVYKWNGSGLTQLASAPASSSPGLGCTSDDSACAIVNSGDIAPPITPYTPKSGTDNVIPAGGFFEGGIDLNSLFPNGLPCVHSFLAETRSSDAVNSELKDLVGGGFNLCSDIKVDKVTNPSGSSQSFNFTLSGGPENINQQFSLTDAAPPFDSGQVKPGTYSLSEAATAGWMQTGSSCDNGSAIGSITVNPGQTVTCTVTNSQNPTLTVTKTVVPSSDTGTFNLLVDGTVKATGGNGTTTGALPEAIGSSHTVSETAADSTDPSNYQEVIGGACNADGTIALSAGQNAVCTITNSRKPQVKVTKSLIPSNDTGKFNLQVNGATKASDVGDGGGTGFVNVDVGSNPTVGEAPGTSTSLDDYESSISCDNGASSSTAGPLSLGTLSAGAKVTCTITNSRKPQVKVTKSLIPSNDTGKFNLQVNGTTQAANVGDGGTTGFVDVVVGSNPTVGETSGSGTSLDNYGSSISCNNGASSSNAGPLSLGTLHAGDQVSCTITNNRKPEVRVRKTLVPSSDSGKFNLQINGTTKATDVGDGGDTGFVVVAVGSNPTVGETAGTGTSLDDYERSISCDNGKSASGSGPLSLGTLHAGDQVTCTITNSREAQVKVTKTLVPSTDGGKFDLQINGTTKATDVGDGGTTGFVDVAVGSNPTVGEDAGTGTSLSDYESSISCSNGASGSDSGPLSLGTVNAGDQVTCTITNSRKPQVKVTKNLVPSNDSGKFNLQINGTTNAANVGDAGTTGFVDVTVGSNPTVRETAGTGTTLADYDSSISCDNSATTSGSGPLSLGTLHAGDQVSCTITNTLKAAPTVTVEKACPSPGPVDASDRFEVLVGGSPTDPATILACGGSADVTLAPKTAYHITERAGNDTTSLDNYDVSYSTGCSSTEGLARGSTGTVCTITNTLKAPPKVTVTKLCPNGRAQPTDTFQAQLDGTKVGAPLACNDSLGVTVTAGKAYAITEAAAGTTDLANYNTTLSEGCSGTLAHYGDTATCTITNTLKPAPTLTVIKKVINDDGGQFKASNFTLSVTGSSPTPASFPGDAGGTVVTLLPGAYSVHEAAVTGYATSMDAGCAGTLAHYGDKATCTVTNNDIASPPPPPPPPPAPSPKIDLVITKAASPNPVTLGDNVTYTLTVTNKGPNQANNVVMTDSLPSEVTFVSVTTNKGTCTGTNAITCNLGQVAVGELDTITIVVKPTVTGTITNTAVVAGNEQELDPSNNKASATVTVNGPFTPPSVCYGLTVRPTSLTVGHRTIVHVKVTQQGKAVAGVRVVIVGKGVNKSATTNAKGVATLVIKSAKPGILQIRVPTHSTCHKQRIGVVGVFTPPVTG